VEAGAGLPQQIQTVVQEFAAGCRVQIFQLLHRDLWLNINYAQNKRSVLNLQIRDQDKRNERCVQKNSVTISFLLSNSHYSLFISTP